jgi:bifunctional non-homologous end joining protein LigD
MPRTKDQLTEYRRKRDFSRTAEPSARKRSKRRGGLEFVIQKHAASHLHYDLRLELDGVMKSWAVPKGPSLDPAVKRLAMQVEDHPMEYNTFEGTIPKGEYGGGTVMLWDRGTYHPDEVEAGESATDAVRRRLRAGKLSFSFEGERLHGSFALVRTDRGPKPKWLLLKHRDDDADDASDITADVVTSVATGRTMDEIAGEADRVWRSNRGRSAGGEEAGSRRAEATADIAPMKPTPLSKPPAGKGWTYEPWWGGTRVIAYATPDVARLSDGRRDVSRRGADAAGELRSLARRVGRPFVAEAELLEDGRLVLTDLLLDGDAVLMARPWRKRRAALDALLRRRRLQRLERQDRSMDFAAALGAARRGGGSGVIARREDAAYEPASKSEGMIRVPLH